MKQWTVLLNSLDYCKEKRKEKKKKASDNIFAYLSLF